MPCHVDAAAPAHSRAAAPPPCDAPQPTPASATADPGSFSPTSPPRTSMDHAALESVNSVATAPETPQPTVVQAASPDDSSVRSGSAQQHLVSPAPDAPYDRHTPAVGGQEKTASPVSPFGSTSDPLAADDDADDALTEDDPRATRRPTFSHTQSSYAKSHGSSNPAAAAAARDAIPDPLADSLGSAGSTPQPRPSGTVAPSARHLLDAEPAQSQAELRGKDHLKERGDENEEDIEDRDDSDSEDEAPDNEPRPSGWFAEAPLVFDMVFNSARSRFSTAVAYATFGALFFFVLTLRTFSFSSSTAAAQISPAKDLPATATLGAPLPAFSFRVLKKDKKPDTDVVVAARFLPSAFHDQLRVALGPDAARDATAAAASVAGPARDVPAVSCAEVLTTAVAPLQFNRYAASLCDPDGFLFSAEATTNGDGVAHFEGVTVGIGAPGTYRARSEPCRQ